MKVISIFNLKNHSEFSKKLKASSYFFTNLTYDHVNNKSRFVGKDTNNEMVFYEFDDNFVKSRKDDFDEDILLEISRTSLRNRETIHDDFKNNLEFIYRTMFNYIADHKSIRFSKGILNYIKKSVVNPCIENLYNKVKYNTINYSKGEPIRDLYDIIFDKLMNKNYKFFIYVGRMFKKFIDGYSNSTKVTIRKVSVEQNNCDYHISTYGMTKDVAISELLSRKKDDKNTDFYIEMGVNLFTLLIIKELSIYIKNKILPKNKYYQYISNDCQAFFSRMISGTNEIYGKYKKTMAKITDDFIANSFNRIGLKIVDMISAHKYWKRNLSKNNLKDLRNYYFQQFNGTENFVEYFNELEAANSLYNSYHHDITCYKEDSIDDKVKHDDSHDKMIKIFNKDLDNLIVKTIDLAVTTSDKVNKTIDEKHLGNKLYQFVFGYLSVLKKVLLKKAVKISNDKVISDTNGYNRDTFINGIIKDMNCSKPYSSLMKRYFGDNPTQINDFTKKFAEEIVDSVHSLIIFDNNVTTSKNTFISQFIDILEDLDNLSNNMKVLILDYLGTSADEIWRSCYSSNRYTEFVSPFIPKNLSRIIIDIIE